ncbi:MAG: integrase/recombinase XerC, partial [Candidatus Binatota bacterium]|nr:integrase/recombinase XerC [Candidatus Binatota bacterium]
MRPEIDHYLEHLRAERNASPHTLRSVRGDLENLRSLLAERGGGEPDVARVSLADLRACVAERLRRVARASVARQVASIRGFFRFLCREEALSRDPAARLGAPRTEQRLPAFLPIDDTERLLNGLGRGGAWAERDRAILETLYSCGLRVSELVGLDWRDLDLENECIRAFGKGRKERIVPIGEIALDAL